VVGALLLTTVLAAWLGTWAGHSNGNGQSITIVRKPDGRLGVNGVATWGGNDPGKVARGQVNLGAFEATMLPTGDRATFQASDNRACTIGLHLTGATLLATDNGACGGMNVTFGGAYHRVSQKAKANPVPEAKPHP
jgi:hypothetical protein